jgi:hypothetical protein
MAETTMVFKAMDIVVSGTTEHTINFNNVLKSQAGYAFITMKTGTAVQFSNNGVAIASGAVTLSSSGNNTKEIFDITRSVPLRYKGGAGSETFNVNITER